MIFSSRKRGGPDSHLDWKVRLFFAGAALALAGIGLESSLLVGVAIAVLLGGVVLRFLPAGDGGREEDESTGQGTLHEDQNSDLPPSGPPSV